MRILDFVHGLFTGVGRKERVMFVGEGGKRERGIVLKRLGKRRVKVRVVNTGKVKKLNMLEDFVSFE